MVPNVEFICFSAMTNVEPCSVYRLSCFLVVFKDFFSFLGGAALGVQKAGHRPSLPAPGATLVAVHGHLVAVTSCCRAQALGCAGFRICNSQA